MSESICDTCGRLVKRKVYSCELCGDLTLHAYDRIAENWVVNDVEARIW